MLWLCRLCKEKTKVNAIYVSKSSFTLKYAIKIKHIRCKNILAHRETVLEYSRQKLLQIEKKQNCKLKKFELEKH